MKIQYPVLLDELKFVFRRLQGFGAFPVYEIVIYGNGIVNYEGFEFVKITGKQTSILEKSKVLKLFKKAIELDVFELDSKYAGEIVYSIDKL
jgi:hypothetical protein